MRKFASPEGGARRRAFSLREHRRVFLPLFVIHRTALSNLSVSLEIRRIEIAIRSSVSDIQITRRRCSRMRELRTVLPLCRYHPLPNRGYNLESARYLYDAIIPDATYDIDHSSRAVIYSRRCKTKYLCARKILAASRNVGRCIPRAFSQIQYMIIPARGRNQSWKSGKIKAGAYTDEIHGRDDVCWR